MTTCLILGGSGYIGFNWARRLAERRRFSRIVIADVRPPSAPLPDNVQFLPCDVRQPFPFTDVQPEWIFNFAAVHREPGHEAREYFDTNLPGAENTCAFAERTGCQNILFTSSIGVYGKSEKPFVESSQTCPSSPYGISKLCAELIQKGWQRADARRRLLICRPGVIYGPGDPGNILRMIRAVRKGYFVFPGSKYLRKSYGYIEGLLDSFEFVMDRSDSVLTYNYVERETETLGELVDIIRKHLRTNAPTLTAPLPLLVAVATVAQLASGGRSPLHPVRVRKTASPTHVVPETLVNSGFQFRYNFAASLQDWASKSPADFA